MSCTQFSLRGFLRLAGLLLLAAAERRAGRGWHAFSDISLPVITIWPTPLVAVSL